MQGKFFGIIKSLKYVFINSNITNFELNKQADIILVEILKLSSCWRCSHVSAYWVQCTDVIKSLSVK